MSKNNGKNKEKKKKEKILDVDDGRTIADMSPISGRKKENGEKRLASPIIRADRP